MLQYLRIYPVFWSASFFSPERKSYDVYIFFQFGKVEIKKCWKNHMFGRKFCSQEAEKGFTVSHLWPVFNLQGISKPCHTQKSQGDPNPTQDREIQRSKFKKSHVNQVRHENVSQINLHIHCKIGCVAIVTLVSLIWKTTRLDWVQKHDHWKCPSSYNQLQPNPWWNMYWYVIIK